jgi:hypothetical protein
MKDPDFIKEIVMRVESAHEPSEVVEMLELSMDDIASAFETEFLDLAHNLGFYSEYGESNDNQEDDLPW